MSRRPKSKNMKSQIKFIKSIRKIDLAKELSFWRRKMEGGRIVTMMKREEESQGLDLKIIKIGLI